MNLVDFHDAYGNLVGIAENKKSELEEYLKLLPQYDNVQKVLLFGSALTQRCNSESDLDLLFVFTGTKNEYRSVVDDLRNHSYSMMCDDIIGYTTEKFEESNPHGLLSVVRKKGVVIYDNKQGVGRFIDKVEDGVIRC